MSTRGGLTIFAWGYWGWGSTAEEFVRAADALERRRSFAPPLFVDVRISRSVRAMDFNGTAFERLIGRARSRHIPELGNRSVRERDGHGIRIDVPSAARDLLDLAVAARREHRRIIFFCACSIPKCNGKITCHRWEVGSLLLKEARRRGLGAEVIEWPGTDPRLIPLRLPAEVIAKLRRGLQSIPLPRSMPLAEIGAINCGSLARCVGGGECASAVVDRPRFGKQGWYLPVLVGAGRQEKPASEGEQQRFGFASRRS